jgi:preprotein translocase subunit SecG
MHTVLLVIHVFVAITLVGIILLQRSEGGGLGLGGGGGSGSFMSVRGTANMLTRTTAILAGLFMVTSLLLAMLAGNHGQGSLLDQMQPPAAPAPASAPAASVPPAAPAPKGLPQVPLAK